MTALCGGGTSSAQPGFGIAVQVGTAQIAALLNNVPTPLAVALAGVIGLVNYELSTFCTTDPPAMPTLTASDYFDALGGNGVAAQITAVAKFQAAIGNILWPSFCKCDSTSTPAPPSWPTPPSDLPTSNPTQLPIGTQQPCWDHSDNFTAPLSSTFHDFTSFLVPYSQTVTVTPPGGAETTTTAAVIPAGVTQYTVKVSVTSPPPPAPGVGFEVLQFNSAGAIAHRDTLWSGNSGSATETFSLVSGATSWEWLANTDPTSGTAGAISAEVSFYCPGTSPTTPATPCCPPDPTLEGMLAQILAYVQALYSSVPPQLNSYATATVHSGLTGNGTVTLVDNALAVRVDITTDDGGGFIPGDPTYLIDRGFIVPVINQGPIRSTVRLVYNPQVYILPALTEQVGYSLHVGVTASITELVAGP